MIYSRDIDQMNKEVSITIKITRKMETFLSPTDEEERISNGHVAQQKIGEAKDDVEFPFNRRTNSNCIVKAQLKKLTKQSYRRHQRI